jgi:hypothetical protein
MKAKKKPLAETSPKALSAAQALGAPSMCSSPGRAAARPPKSRLFANARRTAFGNSRSAAGDHDCEVA